MATIRPGRAVGRPGAPQKNLVFRAQGGRVYVQAWPRKRGRPKLRYQQANLERLTAAQRAVKHFTALEVTTLREGLQEFLRSHQGVRGTAAIRLRDWLTMIVLGKAWSFVVPGFGTLYPATVIREASDVLDVMEPRIGSMLVRTPDGWRPTVNCKPGNVLCMTPTGPYTGACPLASYAPRHEAIGGY